MPISKFINGSSPERCHSNPVLKAEKFFYPGKSLRLEIKVSSSALLDFI